MDGDTTEITQVEEMDGADTAGSERDVENTPASESTEKRQRSLAPLRMVYREAGKYPSQIGFALFIPFLVIDMVVASVLMAMGMMMLSPIIISLPFKIMLFVLVDGWRLVVEMLMGSFGTIG